MSVKGKKIIKKKNRRKCPTNCGSYSARVNEKGQLGCSKCGYIHDPEFLKKFEDKKKVEKYPKKFEKREEETKEKSGRKKDGKHTKISRIDEQIIQLLKENPEGLRQRNIAKILNLKERTSYNHLKKLEKLKLLKNLTPIWKIWHGSDPQGILAELQESSKYNEQGHKICFSLPLIKKPTWWDKRKDRLMNLKEWDFKKEVTAHNNVYHQISNDYMQIQTYKNSIYFICQKKYNAEFPIQIFNQAKDDVLEAIRFLEERFRFKFIAEGNFHLTCIDSHYVTLKDALAEHCKQVGDRFLITTEEGYSLWVDFSESLGTESDNPEVKRRYLRHYKDIIENPNIPLPSEMALSVDKIINELPPILQTIGNQLAQNQKQLTQYHEENVSHLALINEYRAENVRYRKHEKKRVRKEIIKELKDGRQTILKDFK